MIVLCVYASLCSAGEPLQDMINIETNKKWEVQDLSSIKAVWPIKEVAPRFLVIGRRFPEFRWADSFPWLNSNRRAYRVQIQFDFQRPPNKRSFCATSFIMARDPTAEYSWARMCQETKIEGYFLLR